MRALITGAGGFCGGHLVQHLVEKGLDVHTLGKSPADHENHNPIEDVTNCSEIADVLKKINPDYIFHLSGVMQTSEIAEYYRVNTIFGSCLLNAMLEARLENCPVLLVGTSAEYGMVFKDQLPIDENHCPKPYNHYGISKLAQTMEGMSAFKSGLPVVIVRPFNILGPAMPSHLVVQSFALQVANIIKGKMPPIIKVGNLDSSRDFVDVEDAVKSFWDIISNPAAYGEVINLCTGHATFINDILQKLVKVSGISIEVEQDPRLIKNIDVPAHYGCTKKLFSFLNYKLETNIETSLARILEHLKKLP